MDSTQNVSIQCPIPISEYPRVLLAHGGGGRLMHQLIQKMFVEKLNNEYLNKRHDSAVLKLNGTDLAFTTDAYVVRPLFFPGGDIGSLAVHGTINDLAMSGAKPLFLSLSFILEEGLPMETLWRVVETVRRSAQAAGVEIVTGDTKVVDKGKGDQIFINTSGIGIIDTSHRIGPERIREGDAILINGDLGRHGIAVMAVREGLEFETTIETDSAPLAGLVQALLESGIEIHCMRDLTRGGLASALNELAETARVGIQIQEEAIPVSEGVSNACEILGFDPLYVANEGRFVAFVPQKDAARALSIMRSHPLGTGASIIGKVQTASPCSVKMNTRFGTARIIDMLSGEQLPRIC